MPEKGPILTEEELADAVEVDLNKETPIEELPPDKLAEMVGGSESGRKRIPLGEVKPSPNPDLDTTLDAEIKE